MRPKILLLDDDKDLLVLYQNILVQLPSHPEIFICTKGPRALAMLEAEPFTLLICDLNMPKMDGLQVLAIVRRRFPQLRTVAMTSVSDEQFRSRAYGLGVDLFWQKPSNQHEIKQFLDCLESLLGRGAQLGFRGLQSKSLMDIIQMECLSHNSLVLKVTNGAESGRIWINSGEVIDAQTGEQKGELAFRQILSWKSGHFESLPGQLHHPRRIINSFQGLMLESACALDEAKVENESSGELGDANSPLARIARHPGVEFVLVLPPNEDGDFQARGLENPQLAAEWSRHILESFRSLGDRLRAGPLVEVDGLGFRGHVALATHEQMDFCVGWDNATTAANLLDSMKKALSLWKS